MTAAKKKINFRYERSVLVGAEQQALWEVLNQIAKLKSDTNLGAAYRAVYGTDRVTPEATKRIVDGMAGGRAFVVTDGTSTDGKVTNPIDLAAKADALAREGKFSLSKNEIGAYPVDASGNLRSFTAEDFTLLPDGTWPYVNLRTKKGSGGTIHTRVTQLLEHAEMLGTAAPLVVTQAEIDEMQKLSSLAKSLNVSERDLLGIRYAFPPGVTEKLAVSWTGDQVEEEPKTLDASADPLRFDPQRSGLWVARQKGFGKNGQQDSYAVLRVISGFSPQIGDVMFSDPDKSFKVEYQSNRFLIDSATESQAERVAMVETFGETYMYVFGERPKVYNYSGTLADAIGMNWLNEWRRAYREKLRATSTLKLKARAFLVYRDVAREGVIVATMNAQNAAELGIGRFSFQMFVMREYFVDGEPDIDQQLAASTDFLSKKSDDPIKAIEENYDVGEFVDQTGLAFKLRSAGYLEDGTKGDELSPQEKAAFAAETDIVDTVRSQIESRIKADAFIEGVYVRSAGFIDDIAVSVDNAFVGDVFKRAEAEQTMSPGVTVPGGK